MSAANELLDSLSDEELATYTAHPETEDHITIGADRKITIPDNLKRIGVQYDHNVETVTFDCPRYWDNIDMSVMKIYIHYLRPDGSVGCYIAEDVVVDDADDTTMHFNWTISRNVTEKKGNISFLVCIKKTDTDGNEINHWNSELNKDMYVSEGLECGEVIAETYPDVITQILTKLDSGVVGDTIVGNLDDLITEDKSSIVAAINEVANRGIADKAEIKQYVDDLIGTVNDSLENRLNGGGE